MPAKKKNTAIIILDGSGSMHNLQDDVVGAVNSFIADRKKDGSVVYLTVFDDHVVHRFAGKPAKEIEDLTKKDTYLGGSTALLDAIGSTLSRLKTEKLPGKKLVFIYTDGYENASRLYNNASVKALVEELTGKGAWTFAFASAGVDNWSRAQAIGIPHGNYVGVTGQSAGSTISTISQTTTKHFRSGGIGCRAESSTLMTDYGDVYKAVVEAEKKKGK